MIQNKTANIHSEEAETFSQIDVLNKFQMIIKVVSNKEFQL